MRQLQAKAAAWDVTLEETRDPHHDPPSQPLSRTLRWSYAQSILSTIWDIEDGYQIEPNNPSLTLASLLRALL